MNLSSEQENAVAAIERWLQGDQRQPFVLTGYAGTGKTTLLAYLIEHTFDDATFCTVTGKAMNVLKRKLPGARCRTIHNLLYLPLGDGALRRVLDVLRQKPDDPEALKEYHQIKRGNVGFTDREEAEDDADLGLIVVDEASMLSEKMLMDLRRLGRPLMLVGDEMQLPPVKAASIFGILTPDARLTQVHRQALESPIISLATAIREGDNATIERFPRLKYDFTMAMRADKIICHANRTRHNINRMYRKNLGFTSEFPQKDDRLLSVRNGSNYRWVNGAECLNIDDVDPNLHPGSRIFDMNVAYEDRKPEPVSGYLFEAISNYRECHGLQMAFGEMDQNLRSFDYGYCLTVHKSQGSEWDKVYLYDDARRWMQGSAYAQWLYTAVTRAKEKLVWIRE